jgi:hypothetical protein
VVRNLCPAEAAQNGAQGAAKGTRGLRGNVRVSPAI